MNYKKIVIKQMKKSSTVLVATLILGQVLVPTLVVFAEEKDEVQKNSNQEPTEILAQQEQANIKEMISFFEGYSQVSYGYFNEFGEKITIQEKADPFSSRANLDLSEYTPYTFKVKTGDTWFEGTMPVLKLDGEVVFCIEPGVLTTGGDGYSPTKLPTNITQKMTEIATLGYAKKPSYERYVSAQGYIWELMGSTFSTSYSGYKTVEAEIDQEINEYYVQPSFHNQEITVKMGEPQTITDTNHVLSKYSEDFSVGGLKTTRNDNELTVEVTENTEKNAKIEMWKEISGGASIAYVKQGQQTVARFNLTDPARFELRVAAVREGQIQIGKQDSLTGNMVPNTTYTGIIGNDQVTFTTGADGWAPLSSEYEHGTTYSLVESDVPAGYVKDITPITGQIQGGEVTKITQKNNIQLANLTIQKEIEVLNPEATTASGQVVYDMLPAESIPFTNKSITDITAPDKQTVIEQKGVYSDTQVTDSEGKASFQPFYNGEQNKYELTEDQTPENYRPMETKEITVPYGETSVNSIAYTEKIQNLRKKGNLYLNKKNSIDLNNPFNLEHAKFTLKGLPNTPTQDVFLKIESTKDTNKINDLPAGKYELAEIEYPNGFELPDGKTNEIILTIEDEKTTVIDWENQPVVPNVPNNPVIPTPPVVPTTPVTPTPPAVPTTPVTPTPPAVPTTPVTPTPPVVPTTPVTPATPIPSTPMNLPMTGSSTPGTSTKTTGTYPNTGERENNWLVVLGATVMFIGGTAFIYLNRKKEIFKKIK